MIADLYQRPSFAEIAARIGAEPVPVVPVTVPGPEPEPKQAELLPEAPGRLTRCDDCGYLRGMLGHVWACLAPGGRWRR
jgi:hypothetical protein